MERRPKMRICLMKLLSALVVPVIIAGFVTLANAHRDQEPQSPRSADGFQAP